VATSFNYLGVPGLSPTGKITPKAPKAPPPPAPIDAASGLVIGSIEYQRQQDKREMALATAAAGKTATSTATTSSSTGGGIPDDIPKPPADPAGVPVGISRYDAFKKTLALIIGEAEANKPYIQAVFNVSKKYIDSGATAEESYDLTLREARTNPELAPFAKRFKAILNLEDLKAKGQIVQVPTLRDYIKSETAMGTILTQAGFNDLANEDTITEIFSTGKSVSETTRIITNVFDRIKNAPESVKQARREKYPTMTDTQIAKAMLTGTQGVSELEAQAKGFEVLGAARQQGLTAADVNLAQATELGATGYNFTTSLQNFANVKQIAQRGNVLSGVYKQPGITTQTAISAEFNKNAEAQRQIDALAELETSSFKRKSGVTQSSLRGARGQI
jgi:hypothetical protein